MSTVGFLKMCFLRRKEEGGDKFKQRCNTSHTSQESRSIDTKAKMQSGWWRCFSPKLEGSAACVYPQKNQVQKVVFELETVGTIVRRCKEEVLSSIPTDGDTGAAGGEEGSVRLHAHQLPSLSSGPRTRPPARRHMTPPPTHGRQTNPAPKTSHAATISTQRALFLFFHFTVE